MFTKTQSLEDGQFGTSKIKTVYRIFGMKFMVTTIVVFR